MAVLSGHKDPSDLLVETMLHRALLVLGWDWNRILRYLFHNYIIVVIDAKFVLFDLQEVLLLFFYVSCRVMLIGFRWCFLMICLFGGRRVLLVIMVFHVKQCLLVVCGAGCHIGLSEIIIWYIS